MADRHAAHTRNLMTSRAGTGAFARGARAAAPAATTAAPSVSNSVRRNLFQSQLTRRPTPAASVVSTSSNASSDALRAGLDADSGLGDSGSTSPDSATAPAEILVRDRNGEVEMIDLPSPTPDELNEMALDQQQEHERERQRLAEMIKCHQGRSSLPGHPEELLDAVKASLRAKVAALADDNWMYEPEVIPRPE